MALRTGEMGNAGVTCQCPHEGAGRRTLPGTGPGSGRLPVPLGCGHRGPGGTDTAQRAAARALLIRGCAATRGCGPGRAGAPVPRQGAGGSCRPPPCPSRRGPAAPYLRRQQPALLLLAPRPFVPTGHGLDVPAAAAEVPVLRHPLPHTAAAAAAADRRADAGKCPRAQAGSRPRRCSRCCPQRPPPDPRTRCCCPRAPVPAATPGPAGASCPRRPFAHLAADTGHPARPRHSISLATWASGASSQRAVPPSAPRPGALSAPLAAPLAARSRAAGARAAGSAPR